MLLHTDLYDIATPTSLPLDIETLYYAPLSQSEAAYQMIGDLLKQLIAGLWQFFRYHLARLTGSHPTTPGQEPRPTPASTETGGVAALPYEGNLSDAYTRPVRLSTSRRDLDGEEIALNPVFQLWKQQKPRAHKWAHYFEVYHALFGPRRSQALRILEIGVDQGGSLRLWRRYFENPDTVIVGIDIDPTCTRFDLSLENVHVRIGDQADGAFLQIVTSEFGPFDIIIDDGSHHSRHLIQSFNHLFAHALKDDGIYVAEDLHANYWTPFRDTRSSFLDLCKELMELMHAPYTRATFGLWLLESESGSPSDQVSLEVPIVATMIKEIRVFDSIVAIQKTRRKYLPRVLNPIGD